MEDNVSNRLRVWLAHHFGHTALHYGIMMKRLRALHGAHTQRVMEYPWAISQISELPKGRVRVLDVGVAESFFHYELIKRGFDTYRIDVNSSQMVSPKLNFVQNHYKNSGLPDSYFDAVFVISTIEHIGLASYGKEKMESKIKQLCSKFSPRALRIPELRQHKCFQKTRCGPYLIFIK